MSNFIPMALFAIIFLAREYMHHLETRGEAEQRSMLLQRIQAPREIAYKEFAESLPQGAPSLPLQTDEEAWQALEDLPPKALALVPTVEDWEGAMGDVE